MRKGVKGNEVGTRNPHVESEHEGAVNYVRHTHALGRISPFTSYFYFTLLFVLDCLL